jgi:aryl-alcohol dehydrogenase-like predicted oxidoreductase
MERQLGQLGPVSAMGMGCWAIGGPFWTPDGKPLGWGEVDDDASVRAVHRALDAGVTFFDTADVYGTGHSERILGRALGDRRDDVVIATKFGNVFDEQQRVKTGTDASPDHIRRACRASLDRLATDRIDLYQFHLADHPPGDATAVVEVLEELVDEGLIRAYAWSTDDPARAAVFAEGGHCAAVQHELSVFHTAPQMLTLCAERGLASVNRSPLAMGLLTGKFDADSVLGADDVRGEEPEWLRFFTDGRPTPEFLDRLDAVRDVLTSDGRSLAQGSLAYLWGMSPVTIPIPGCRVEEQVIENAGAMAMGPLRSEQVAEVDRLRPRRRRGGREG